MYYYENMASYPFNFNRNETYFYNNQLIESYNPEDERFFGFGILPFVAGLAIAPLLFNRPCYPPFPPPYAYYPPPYAFPPPMPPQPFPPVYGNVNENINIYTK